MHIFSENHEILNECFLGDLVFSNNNTIGIKKSSIHLMGPNTSDWLGFNPHRIIFDDAEKITASHVNAPTS